MTSPSRARPSADSVDDFRHRIKVIVQAAHDSGRLGFGVAEHVLAACEEVNKLSPLLPSDAVSSIDYWQRKGHVDTTPEARAGDCDAVPQDVRYALDRMCTPLDPSRLGGATADADARCMKVIRDYIDRLTTKATP